jgi:hypothetical protein
MKLPNLNHESRVSLLTAHLRLRRLPRSLLSYAVLVVKMLVHSTPAIAMVQSPNLNYRRGMSSIGVYVC